MTLIKILPLIFLVVFLIITFSCEENMDTYIKDSPSFDTLDTYKVHEILFNIPINDDTIFMDKDHNIDFRIEIEGHKIDSTFLIIDNNEIIKRDSFIISSNSLYLLEGLHKIVFLIRSINSNNGDTVFYRTNQENLKIIKNLSIRYINETINNGKLQLTWPELDKKNTKKYLIERIMGENLEYSQEIEVQDSIYLDNYYVGEEANFKISVINNEGNKQNIWYYKKPSEKPVVNVSLNKTGGYRIHFSKSKYTNSFGQYYLTTGFNFNPDLLFSSSNIEDTIYTISDAKFADVVRIWLRYLPKKYPQGLTNNDWMLYGKFIYARCGVKSFEYIGIAIINNENVVYTSNSNIYKYNIPSDQKTDSIVHSTARYDFLRTTPAGNYLYAIDGTTFGSPVYFWTTNTLSTNPNHTFSFNSIIPPVSDNLIAIMGIPSQVTPSKMALYNVMNGDIIFTTDYNDSSNRPKISSNGEYFFIYDLRLKLCSYTNNIFKLIWEENDWPKFYQFYDFDSQNDDKCYIWDNNKKFSIRRTLDFSELNSFSLELENIINIDYYTRKIMGYVTDKIRVYNLDDGTLEKEIPANLNELILSGNFSVLIGKTIYSNYGIKYIIE